MNYRALSIKHAANLSPNKIFIICNDKKYTFKQIAALVKKRSKTVIRNKPFFVTAHINIESIVEILTALENRLLLVLLNPADSILENSKIKKSPLIYNSYLKHNINGGIVIFSSGTSGGKKGVLLSYDTLTNSEKLSSSRLQWKFNDRWILTLPLAHIGGFSILIRTLLNLKTIILIKKFTVQSVFDSISKNKGTMLSVVPSMLKKLIDNDDKQHLSKLRVLLIGGASISLQLLSRCRQKKLNAFITYGMTETASQVATSSIKDLPGNGNSLSFLSLDGVTIFAVDKYNNKVEDGKTGRLVIKGDILMEGYINTGNTSTVNTSIVNTEHSDLCQSGFKTGDLGIIKNKRVQILGRADNVIITGGENVYPQKVEDTLKNFSDLTSAVIFGISDPKWGETVCAALNINSTYKFDADRFKEFCRQNLAAYEKPKKIALLTIFPLMDNGKLDRTKIIKSAKNKLILLKNLN